MRKNFLLFLAFVFAWVGTPALPAHAVTVNSYAYTAGGSLQDSLASTVFDLSAQRADSYPGAGQIFANLVRFPADGSPQAAYDFCLGTGKTVTGSDPTFNGTAGTAAAYFSVDGGDQFTINDGTLASNTTLINSLGKTTGFQSWWMAIAMYNSDQTTSVVPFSNQGASTTDGMRLNIASGDNLQIFQGSGGVAKASSSFSPVLSNNANHLIVVSYDGANIRYWIDTFTKTTLAYTYNAQTNDAAAAFKIFGSLANGSRLYNAAMGNAYIDDAQAAIIINTFEARTGIDFTP